jgi:transposase
VQDRLQKEIAPSPIAIEVVRRNDALFEIECSINGKSAEGRLEVRRTLSRLPGRGALGPYAGASRQALLGYDLAKAFNYILKRWASLTLSLEDGCVYLSNNATASGSMASEKTAS